MVIFSKTFIQERRPPRWEVLTKKTTLYTSQNVFWFFHHHHCTVNIAKLDASCSVVITCSGVRKGGVLGIFSPLLPRLQKVLFISKFWCWTFFRLISASVGDGENRTKILRKLPQTTRVDYRSTYAILVFRSHEEDQHTQLRGVPYHDQRVQRVLRVLGGAVTRGHRDDQPASAHHVRGSVLQHHGHRRCKYKPLFFCNL